jgi:hypothetical protein
MEKDRLTLLQERLGISPTSQVKEIFNIDSCMNDSE